MGDNKYANLFNQDLNLSTLFFARPMMYSLNTFGKKNIIDIRNKHYETGFTKCELDEHFYKEGKLFLTYDNKIGYKNVPIRNWEFFYDSVKKSKLYINDFDLDEDTTVFYLNFPEKWIQDYEKILEGTYSKVSYNFMSTFFSDDNNLLYHLRNKTSDAKEFYAEKFHVTKKVFDDCEIGPKFEIEKEILQINNNLAV